MLEPERSRWHRAVLRPVTWPAEMASIGMEGLQEIHGVFPDNLDEILERLEAARQRIY